MRLMAIIMRGHVFPSSVARAEAAWLRRGHNEVVLAVVCDVNLCKTLVITLLSLSLVAHPHGVLSVVISHAPSSRPQCSGMCADHSVCSCRIRICKEKSGEQGSSEQVLCFPILVGAEELNLHLRMFDLRPARRLLSRQFLGRSKMSADTPMSVDSDTSECSSDYPSPGSSTESVCLPATLPDAHC